jgi:hypothetical protein
LLLSQEQRNNSQHLAVISFADPSAAQHFREKPDADG